jgi:hypothetical protein
MTRNWQQTIDQTDQIGPLRELLAELNSAIEAIEDSPYAEEPSLTNDLRTLELLREYLELKIDRLLD